MKKNDGDEGLIEGMLALLDEVYALFSPPPPTVFRIIGTQRRKSFLHAGLPGNTTPSLDKPDAFVKKGGRWIQAHRPSVRWPLGVDSKEKEFGRQRPRLLLQLSPEGWLWNFRRKDDLRVPILGRTYKTRK